MSAPQDRRIRLLAALYAKFGEAADWTPAAGGAATPVTVRPATSDVEIDFGRAGTVAAKDLVLVRKGEIAAPAVGDEVALADRTLKVMGQPRKRHQGLEWACEVQVIV